MMLWLTLANAGVVNNIGEPVEFELAGTFARLFPLEDDTWRVALGAGRGVKFQTVDDELFATDQFQDIVSGTEFIDTAIAPCPDGGWLIAGSGNVESHNDTLWVYRLDANDQIVGNSTVVDRQSGANTNDMAVVCSSIITGVGWAETFAHIDANGQVSSTVGLDKFLMGAGITIDGQVYITTDNGPNSGDLTLTIYDSGLSVTETHTLEVEVGNGRVYWPMRLLQLDEDTFMVISMARNDGDFQADEGNVWLHFYDASWEHKESTQISAYGGPVGCMRPWVSRRGDTLMVSWDSEIRPYGVKVTIGGVGTVDTADPDDTAAGDTDEPIGGKDCGGCGGGLGGLVGLALPLLVRRRRSPSG